MSLTLTYDIGHSAVAAVVNADWMAFDAFRLRTVVRRYDGPARRSRECGCFTVRLPSQAGLAYRLIQSARRACSDGDGVARKGCRTLARNLTAAMGLPPAIYGHSAMECSFLDAIEGNPSESANWAAYADWLSESGHPAIRKRGELIAGWLNPHKALRKKNGVPLLVLEIRKLLCA